MAGAFLATNEIDDSATITPSTEDSSYPVENIYDRQAANVFRCESKTALTILIDFGSDISADTIALINHNLSSSATLSLKAGAASPPVTEVAVPTYREHDLWKAFTLTTARYWLLTIADSNSDYLEIGQMILGQRTAFPIARRIGQRYSPATQRSNVGGETYAGVVHSYHLFERTTLNPSFRVDSAADLAVLQGLDQAVYGNLYPFLYVPDSSEAACYYVRKDLNFGPVEINRIAAGELVHDYQMNLVEESRGLDIQE